MTNATKILMERWDSSKPFNDMAIELLELWDTDNEFQEELKDVTADDFQQSLIDIYKLIYSKDTLEVGKEKTFSEFKTYTKENLLVCKTTKDTIIISNTSIGVEFSKTAFKKFEKNFSIDDITRQRLYQMFHDHTPYFDNFVTELKKNNIHWSPIEIKNPIRMLDRFPKISV